MELADNQQSSCLESSVTRSPANQKKKEDMTGTERVKGIPIKPILYLNKPKLLVLFLGFVVAVARSVFYPIHGLMMSSAIKILYEPPNKVRKGSSCWALMFVGVGICSLLFVPLQNCFLELWESGAVDARLATDASTMRNIVGDALALVVQT
ncbi:hypothetical protein Ccrd_020824 [Cynara cardunculus var. scolymus]|uniref:Uncharacterized protein n=1 Tax=Cynara cardunculus var. scolymus TaxID=59895 RepID=A0A103Y1Q9_CYNCS|nr:hypothetical protein Ccrd_020824 [Cynara cardunculus var. scolymus]